MAEGASRTYKDKHRRDHKSRQRGSRGHDERFGFGGFSRICRRLGMITVRMSVFAYVQGAIVGLCG